MVRTNEFSSFFQRMLDAPDDSIAAMREDPRAFEQEIVAAEGNTHSARAALPDRRSLGFALFDAAGEAIACETPSWLPVFSSRDDLKPHVDARSNDGSLLCITRDSAPPLFGFWAPYDDTKRWNMPASVRQIADSARAATVVVFVASAREPINDAAAAFGLNPSQRRVVAAVIKTGSLRRAATELGISYATAREAMSAVTRRMRVTNLPAAVRAVVAAAFGILPGDVDSPVQLVDTLCLSERQAQVALLISSGSSREASAKALGTSVAVIKKELQILFASLGVQTATELACLITETQALRTIARSTDNAPGFLDPAIEPSRYSLRSNGRGIIAWSDYGPASGNPVLVVHSNWCCRAVPLPLLKELQRRGWRPIAIDRPGFGATSLGASSADDPFGQAVEDALQVLAELKIARFPIVARCGAQFVHAFASRVPERVGPVVLVSPTPEAHADGKRAGAVGAFKEAFYRSPRLVEIFFRVISSQFTFARVEQLMRSITRGSLDETLCDDPQFIRDRFRALRPFACGGYVGGILEELVISHGGWDFAPIETGGWKILQGAEDYHQDIEEVQNYWMKLLPKATIVEVPGGGRFMTSSMPQVVVDYLESD